MTVSELGADDPGGKPEEAKETRLLRAVTQELEESEHSFGYAQSYLSAPEPLRLTRRRFVRKNFV